jgi:peptidoglycan/LPS O-acetylase OafA/YrhL
MPYESRMYGNSLGVFRAVLCLLVVAFHGYLYWATSGDQSAFGAEEKVHLVNQSPFLKLLSFANLGVDGFIVLSGFLAGRSFLASPCRFSLRAYLAKKVRRILVPYWLTLLAILAGLAVVGNNPTDPFFGYCPGTLALSPLLLNNFIGFGGCGVHLWSVAVQIHLFVVFGLACKAVQAWVVVGKPGDAAVDPSTARKGMAALTGAALVGSIALRIAMAMFFGSRFPPPPFDHPGMSPEARDAAMRYYHVLYFATPSRATNFFTGVLLSLLFPILRPWSARASRAMALAATFVTSSYLGLLASVDYRGGDWGPWYGALVFHGSPMASIVMALLLVSAIVAPGPPQFPSRTARTARAVVQWLSDHSYLIYLVHPLMMRLLWLDGRMTR